MNKKTLILAIITFFAGNTVIPAHGNSFINKAKIPLKKTAYIVVGGYLAYSLAVLANYGIAKKLERSPFGFKKGSAINDYAFSDTDAKNYTLKQAQKDLNQGICDIVENKWVQGVGITSAILFGVYKYFSTVK